MGAAREGGSRGGGTGGFLMTETPQVLSDAVREEAESMGLGGVGGGSKEHIFLQVADCNFLEGEVFGLRGFLSGGARFESVCPITP